MFHQLNITLSTSLFSIFLIRSHLVLEQPQLQTVPHNGTIMDPQYPYLFPGVLRTGHGVSDGPRIDEYGVIVAALHRAVAEEVNRLRGQTFNLFNPFFQSLLIKG